MGEEVKAVVQPVEGVTPNAALEAELVAYAREHIAHYKCPKSVDFRDELPRLPTGKLYKRLAEGRVLGEDGEPDRLDVDYAAHASVAAEEFTDRLLRKFPWPSPTLRRGSQKRWNSAMLSVVSRR